MGAEQLTAYENLLEDALGASRNEVVKLRQQLTAVNGELERARQAFANELIDAGLLLEFMAKIEHVATVTGEQRICDCIHTIRQEIYSGNLSSPNTAGGGVVEALKECLEIVEGDCIAFYNLPPTDDLGRTLYDACKKARDKAKAALSSKAEVDGNDGPGFEDGPEFEGWEERSGLSPTTEAREEE
jgi:hypothetical protein